MALGRAGGNQDWTSLISSIFGTSNVGDNDKNRRTPYSTSSRSRSKQSKDRAAQSWESLKRDNTRSTRSSTRHRKQPNEEQASDPLSNLWSTFTGGGGAGGGEDAVGGIGGYAQKWVKEALLRASGLDGVLGGGAADPAASKDEDKKRRAGGR